jgi:hypothetical protein
LELALLTRCAVALVAIGAAACANVDRKPPDEIVLAVPGRINANASIAAQGPFVVVVWSASDKSGATDVYAAVSRDGANTFSGPSIVNSTPGSARVNGEQPPRVALVTLPSGARDIVVIWTGKGEIGTALLTARSTDGGRTFSSTSVVPDTDVAGNRGWEAIGADNKGGVYAVWLDHRRLAERDGQVASGHRHAGHQTSSQSEADGVAMAQLSQLYFDALGDVEGPRPLTGGVCYCCKTAIASGTANEIYLAWRHVYPGNMRDIAFAASQDGGRTFAAPVRVSEDHWAISGCPDDGPAMAIDQRGVIHVVWPTVVTEGAAQTKALFHATTRDGRRFTARVRLPTEGQAHHPQLAITPDGTLAAAWDETGSGTRHIAFARGTLDESGNVQFRRQPTAGSEVGVYPVLAAAEGGILAAWTSAASADTVIRVQRQF